MAGKRTSTIFATILIFSIAAIACASTYGNTTANGNYSYPATYNRSNGTYNGINASPSNKPNATSYSTPNQTTYQYQAAGPYVNMTEPYNLTVLNNQTVYLGNVGPGQTFYITISAATTNAAGGKLNLGWNELQATGVPSRWIAQNSSLYSQFPSIKITPSPNAPNGTYAFHVHAINVGNYSKIGNLTFRAYVNITPKVFSLSVSPVRLSTAPSMTANILVTINNTGVSDAPFVISGYGLPAWNYTQVVIAPHHTARKFIYPVSVSQPGVYHVTISVNSTATPLIHQQNNVTLVVRHSIASDYSAIGQGTIAFPVIYAPAYAVMYLIRLLFK